jgi:hypothetical protein
LNDGLVAGMKALMHRLVGQNQDGCTNLFVRERSVKV